MHSTPGTDPIEIAFPTRRYGLLGETDAVTDAEIRKSAVRYTNALTTDRANAVAVVANTSTAVWVKQFGSVQAHLLGLTDFKGENWDQWPATLADLKIRQHPETAMAVSGMHDTQT